MGFFSRIEDGVRNLGRNIEDEVRDFGSKVEDVARSAGSALEDGVRKVAKPVGGLLVRVTEHSNPFRYIPRPLHRVLDPVLDGVDQAAEWLTRKVEEAGPDGGWGARVLESQSTLLRDWTRAGTDVVRGETPLETAAAASAALVASAGILTGQIPLGRPLTDAEIALLRRVFGDSLDYSEIRVHEGDETVPSSVGAQYRGSGHIHVRDGVPLTPALLVHETMHFWQDAREDMVTDRLLGERNKSGEAGHGFEAGYDFVQAIDEGRGWDGLTYEEQAEFVATAYRLGYFGFADGARGAVASVVVGPAEGFKLVQWFAENPAAVLEMVRQVRGSTDGLARAEAVLLPAVPQPAGPAAPAVQAQQWLGQQEAAAALDMMAAMERQALQARQAFL